MTAPISWRAAAAGLGAGALALLVIGLPTAVIPNPWFTRMTPTRPQDYLFLGLTGLLTAAIGVTYARPATCSVQEGKVTTGGLLSLLAIGCPICNKLVVLLLGTSGALTYFEPLQPVLALAAIGVLGFTLFLRLRASGALPARFVASFPGTRGQHPGDTGVQ